ncbi:MAG: sensor domain-containing diguanylate cyclase [Lachnospiraceae bacterium]|nr:sensor domain-containing diguanylate cyclase [Lachnospiraceae bacterium]
MIKEIIASFKLVASRHGWKNILIIIFWTGLFALVFLFNFKRIFDLNKENTGHHIDESAYKFEIALNKYLDGASEYITNLAENIEYLKTNDVPKKHIDRYFEMQKQIFLKVRPDNAERIYMYFDGKFYTTDKEKLDDEFEPTDQDWYRDSYKSDSRVVYTLPDEESVGAKIFTISKRLKGSRDVVAVDIYLEELRNIIEEIYPDNRFGETFVIDDDGVIVVGTVESEIGKNYFSESGENHEIVTQIFIKGNNEFVLGGKYDRKAVFAREIGGGWHIYSIMEYNKAFKEYFSLIQTSVVIGIVGFLFVFLMTVLNTARLIRIEEMNLNLVSVSSIYVSMHKINLEEDSFEEINCSNKYVASLIGSKRDYARARMGMIMERLTVESSRKKMMEFSDLGTVAERMADNDTITEEFIDNKNKWCRARFIVTERNEQGKATGVIWLVELIDKEKRNREKLKKLSETDAMTGIYNRGGGEKKINNQLEKGARGMFILLDADKFKSVNDTFGHAVGDKVIIAIADAMKKTFRDKDVIMRLGGDEFAAYIADINTIVKGRVILERFIKNIGSIVIPEMGDRRIEVSVGAIIHAERDNVTFSELYKCADQATYESKRSKGSCVTFYNEIL